MWNGIGWYGFIGPTTSTTDISLDVVQLSLGLNRLQILSEDSTNMQRVNADQFELCWKQHFMMCT